MEYVNVELDAGSEDDKPKDEDESSIEFEFEFVFASMIRYISRSSSGEVSKSSNSCR